MQKNGLRTVPIVFSFYMLQALLPALIILAFILNFLEYPLRMLQSLLNTAFPEDAANLFMNFIIFKTNQNAFTIIVFIISLNIVTGGVDYLIHFMNNINGTIGCNRIAIRVRSYIFTIFVILSFSLFLLFLLWLSSVSMYLLFPALWLLLFTVLCLAFSILPCKIVKIKNVFVGSALSSLLMSLLLSLMPTLSKVFINYRTIYGSLSSIMILFFVFQLMGYFLYFGITINSIKQLENKK